MLLKLLLQHVHSVFVFCLLLIHSKSAHYYPLSQRKVESHLGKMTLKKHHWYVHSLWTSFPVNASQICTLLLLVPEAIKMLSGENATDQTMHSKSAHSRHLRQRQ